MSYLHLKIPDITQSIYIKIQRETNHYYYIKKYPTLGINPTFNLKVQNNPELVRINKNNINYCNGLIVLKQIDKIPPIDSNRIYD